MSCAPWKIGDEGGGGPPLHHLPQHKLRDGGRVMMPFAVQKLQRPPTPPMPMSPGLYCCCGCTRVRQCYSCGTHDFCAPPHMLAALQMERASLQRRRCTYRSHMYLALAPSDRAQVFILSRMCFQPACHASVRGQKG